MRLGTVRSATASALDVPASFPVLPVVPSLEDVEASAPLSPFKLAQLSMKPPATLTATTPIHPYLNGIS
jgi:hypothetical protein